MNDRTEIAPFSGNAIEWENNPIDPAICPLTCNLVGYGDFETFPTGKNTYYPSFTNPYNSQIIITSGNSGVDLNSVDVQTDGSNQYARMISLSNGYHENLLVPICQEIPPGCDITVSFDACMAIDQPPGQPVMLGVWALSQLPTPMELSNTTICNGLLPDNSGNTIGTCLGEVPLPDDCGSSINFTSFSVSGSFTQTVTHIWFFDNSSLNNLDINVFMDNISVTNNCQNHVDVTPTVLEACVDGQAIIDLEVCLNGTLNTPATVTLTPDLSGISGISLSAVNPDFPNGVATITGLLPGQCSTPTLFLDIDAGVPPGVPVTIPAAVSVSGACAQSPDIEITLVPEYCDSLQCGCPPGSIVIGSPGVETLLSSLVPGTLPASPSLPLNLTIRGTLVINGNYIFPLGSDICMDAGAEIRIEPNNSLTISDSHLRGCDERWKSITVRHDATLNLEGDGLGLVEDAQYAVHPHNKANVNIINTRFNKNYISLYFDDPGGEFFLTPFHGNTMECTTGLLPHYDPLDPNDGPWSFAGIYTKGQDGMFIGVAGAGVNRFDALRNGIITENCNLTLRNTSFQNITDNNEYGTVEGFCIHAISATGAHTLRQQGFGQTGALSFDNCFTAIFTDGMRVEQISDNNMLNLHTGIRVENGFEDVNIQHNAIDAGAYGIRVNQANPNTHLYIGYNTLHIRNPKGYGITLNEAGLSPSDGFDFAINDNEINLHSSLNRGIRLLSVNGASVRNNDVVALDNAANFTGYMVYGSWDNTLLCNTSTGLGAASGMGIYAWDAENTAWSCNQVSDSRIGLYLNMGGWSPDMFIGTDFSNHYYGLQIDDGDGINSGELGPQHHTGNRWTGSYSGDGTRHESNDPQVVQNSQFIVHLTTPPYHPSVSVVPPVMQTDFFFTEVGTPNTQCLSPFACPEDEFTGAPLEIKGVDSLIAGGAFDSPAFQPEFRWLAERYLYRKLQRHPELVTQGPVIDTFFTEKAGQPVGQFQAVRQSIKGLYDLTPEDSAAVAGNFASITGKLDEIAGIDSALVNASGPDSLLLVQQRDTAIQVLDSLTLAQDTLLSGIQVQRTANAGPVIAGNNAITVTQAFEQNEQDVNNIFLNTLAKGVFTFDSIQQAELEGIAFQCPLTGGSAVFRARGFLALAGDYEFDDKTICDTLGERSSSIEKTLKIFKVNTLVLVPNPSNGVVTGYLPDEITGGVVTLTDYMGRQILALELIGENVKQFTLDVQQLSAGIYHCTIRAEDGRLFMQSLVVQ